MSLFKKPKKNVKNRGPVGLELTEEQEEESLDIQANINQLKLKEKEKKKKKRDKNTDENKKKTPAPVLSFEDEEEDEDEGEFKVKKSSASRRLMKQKTRTEKESRFFSDPPPPPPYSPPRILSSNGAKRHPEEYKVQVEDDIEIVIKDTVPKKSVEEWTLSGKEAEALHMEEEDLSEDEQEVISDEEDPLKKIIQSGGIPDAMSIHLARKKREAAREAGGKEDFIPIQKGAEGARKKVHSRLVREEDEDVHVEERIGFTVKESRKEDEYHGRVRVEDGDSDSDPEWEKMQINKAISGQQMLVASQEARLNAELGMPRAPLPPSITVDRTGRSIEDTSIQASLQRPVKYDLPGIRERMRRRLEEMKEVGRRHEQDADRACDDMVESQGEIDKAEEEVPRLATKHRFFQELRGYVTDYTECYDEKVGTIAYMESRLCKVASERRGKLRERRRQDVRDQAEALAAMTATAAYLGVSGPLGADPVQEEIRKHRVAEREGRRTRRRQAREARGEARHRDGESSDEEMPSKDKAVLDKVRDEVTDSSARVLEDVVAEFSSLPLVSARLGAWRTEDDQSYQSAYVSLCLHRIFSPLVRHQELFWSPFRSTVAVSEQSWHGQLAGYGLAGEQTEEQWREDPDRNLLSAVTEKVLLPKLVNLVRAEYDPVSTSQTQRLVGCLARTVQDFPTLTPRCKQLKELLQVVVAAFKECLDNDVYIPMYNKSQTDSPTSPHSIFFQRQFWAAFKLFRNILAWQGVLSDGVLVELSLDRLLNRYLLLSLRANRDMLDSVDKARQILQLLPPWWLKTGSSQLKKLEMMAKWVLGVGTSKGMARDGVLECAKIVKRLGDETGSENLRELLISQPK